MTVYGFFHQEHWPMPYFLVLFSCFDKRWAYSASIEDPAIAMGHGSLNLSSDKIFIISCLTQTRVTAELLFDLVTQQIVTRYQPCARLCAMSALQKWLHVILVFREFAEFTDWWVKQICKQIIVTWCGKCWGQVLWKLGRGRTFLIFRCSWRMRSNVLERGAREIHPKQLHIHWSLPEN